mmetsp:Transcript_13733/g.40600  ORF Transcript_13733/g.40600 Transcript_13733/m.40600 type:complete len:213 (+) Transcript_13733:160-798(+)
MYSRSMRLSMRALTCEGVTGNLSCPRTSPMSNACATVLRVFMMRTTAASMMCSRSRRTASLVLFASATVALSWMVLMWMRVFGFVYLALNRNTVPSRISLDALPPPPAAAPAAAAAPSAAGLLSSEGRCLKSTRCFPRLRLWSVRRTSPASMAVAAWMSAHESASVSLKQSNTMAWNCETSRRFVPAVNRATSTQCPRLCCHARRRPWKDRM